MKIEGSIQEIKDFMKEFQCKDTLFTKQQLSQIQEKIKENMKKAEWNSECSNYSKNIYAENEKQK